MKSLYIKSKHITDSSIDDLDFINRDSFGFDENVHEDVVEITEGNPNVDTAPVSIKSLLEILNSMVNSGCTHVAIDYHCDHIGYDLSGFLIREATKDERVSFITESIRKKEIEERKAQLRKELRELEKEGLKKIETDLDDLPF
jgi:hypothetical protein